ncbi:bifunctional 4-hydroxy-2-oxoglutarate aldolase/2-dehydro-3-deoxy-phosphogluconate aldolase [Marinicrinis sediminis]|uniref:Bifunctional 4-hydroxy-2-oxoglutarate aldolase/2-dehydro-3-deoxy-phosphogluconate aldolase n=1 Tax=Marinicrinis sediminis TaxID=1652465 RepID=A0ABW5R9K1_9BACL
MNDIESRIRQEKVIVIARGVSTAPLLRTAEAMSEGGLRVLEVTLNTPEALTTISELRKSGPGDMLIGAGTVLDRDDLEKALEAGAQYIVTPHVDESVIETAAKAGVPIYPGAMTPTEIVRAWKAGASAVKLFPNQGLNYLKDIQGPLSHIPLVAVGGISVDNVTDYLKQNVYAIGIGSYIIHQPSIEAGHFAEITRRSSVLSEQVKSLSKV